MATYQPYLDFTAQSKTVSTLMSLYAQFESKNNTETEFTTIIVFTAFVVKAYLNSIGSREIAFWEELERLPWKQKIEILHKNAEVNPDWGQEPLQFANEVFRLRDKLAHGKPERVEGPIFPTMEAAGDYQNSSQIQPDWYRGMTKEWAISAKDRFRALMIYLGKLYKLHESDYLHSASGGIRPIDA